MEPLKADHEAAARLSITAEEAARHRTQGRHMCVDGRWYTASCLVVDPTCTAIARHRLHGAAARTARPGELIRVIGHGGALDGLSKVDRTYSVRVREVTVRDNLNGWDQIDGVIEQLDQPRMHGKERSLLARPWYYDILS
jgi:hypothetical protein